MSNKRNIPEVAIVTAAKHAELLLPDFLRRSHHPEKYFPKKYDTLHEAEEYIRELDNSQRVLEALAHGYWTRIGYDPSFEQKYTRDSVLTAYNSFYACYESLRHNALNFIGRTKEHHYQAKSNQRKKKRVTS